MFYVWSVVKVKETEEMVVLYVEGNVPWPTISQMRFLSILWLDYSLNRCPAACLVIIDFAAAFRGGGGVGTRNFLSHGWVRKLAIPIG